MRFLAVITCFLSFAAPVLATSQANAASSDPLFSHMEGQWTGQGTRTYPISGRITQVSAQVDSSVSLVDGQQRLTSDNQITETASGVAPQTYESDYWIEPTPGQTGQYSMGTAQTSTTSGSLSDQAGIMEFVSDQNLGNGYNIHSETVFNQLGSLFTETVTSGNQLILRSVIQYQRIQ